MYRVLLLLIISAICSFSTQAHTRSQSFSQWHLEDESVSVNFNILTREITRLAADASVDVRKDLDQLLIEHLSGKIQARLDGEACTMTTPLYSLPASKGYTRLEARLACPTGKVMQLELSGFFDIVPSHLHYARVIRTSGEATEIVLSDSVRMGKINLEDLSKNYWDIAKTYIDLGVEHILMGYDHLIFLLALLLLCRRMSQALILITGFTLGHSITLSLSVLGWLQPNMVTIEALIGFSIALVALEKIQTLRAKNLAPYVAAVMIVLMASKLIAGIGLPFFTLLGMALVAVSYLLLVRGSSRGGVQFLLTTSFGFVHGFGFASVLREIGLPPTELGLALFSFNLGVELGQLMALGVMALIAFMVNKVFSMRQQQLATQVVVNLVLGLGTYWFMFRSIG